MKHTNPDDLKIVAAYRAPFSLEEPTVMLFEPDSRVSEIIAGMPLPEDFSQPYRGSVILVGPDREHKLRRKFWSKIRLKGGQRLVFAYRMADGGGDGGGSKAVLSVVLAVATILTAGAAALGAFGAGAGTLFGVGTLSAKLLAAGISVAGNILGQFLVASPAQPTQGGGGGMGQNREPASVSGNLLAKASPIPRVIGTRLIYPPLGAQPLVERVGPDEFAEAFFVLAGPHLLEDIRVGGSPIEEAEDITIQTREGWTDDAPMDLVIRYGRTEEPRLQLSSFVTDGNTDYRRMQNQENPSQSVPKFHSFACAEDCDEIWLHFTLPGGLAKTNNNDDRVQMPIRIRMRASTSDPWINLPEIHYRSKIASEIRPTVRLKWGAAPPIPTVPANEGFVTAFLTAPGQTEPPVTAAWNADANWDNGGGGATYLDNGNEATTRLRRITLSQYEAVFYIDEATIPKGEYQVEIKRGMGMKANNFNETNYEVDGEVRDLFYYQQEGTVYEIRESTEYISDRLYLMRFVSVFNQHPIFNGDQGSGLAVIAVRSLNREVPNLSVRASGYVPDWDGTAWANMTTTSNPAPHYRYVLRGELSPWPLDEILVDNDSLVAWRQRCIDDGLTVNKVCEGEQLQEVLTKVAGVGMARPRQSETWGVVQDYDRSAEDPSQIFSQRNSNELTLEKAFSLIPDAFLVTFKDAESLDKDTEILVWRPGREGTVNPRVEAIQYDGIDNEAQAVERAIFDLRQLELRGNIWSLLVPAEGIRTTRGDLVGYNSDTIDITHGSARIVDVEVLDDEIIAVHLDTEVQIYNEPGIEDVPAIEAVEYIELIGLQSSISIRQSDSFEAVEAVAGVTGKRDRIELATPIEIDLDGDDGEPLIRYDCLVTVGEVGNVAMRLIVTDVQYERDHFARLTMANEAPELFEAA